MAMGEFIIFCKDFNIPLSKIKCAKVYKLTATRSKEMDIDQFTESIQKLFVESYKEEIERLEKRLVELKRISRNKKQKKRDNNLNQSIETNLQTNDQNDTFETYKEINNAVKLDERPSQGNFYSTYFIEISKQSNDISQSYGYARPLQRSIGGNPMNPQVSLKKQVAAEREYLERNKGMSKYQSDMNTIEYKEENKISIDPTTPNKNSNDYQQRSFQSITIDENTSINKVYLPSIIFD